MNRTIYSIIGSTPEIAAYGMAKYSRSALGLQESLRELSAQKTEEFLNTFYFQYGHSSIADLAHVAVALEQISIWAAMVVVDEPLWDGQERSTRYQDFKKTKYYTPKTAPARYVELADHAFARYDELTHLVKDAYAETYERPSDLAEDAYHRTLRARAFDVSRYWLPLSTNTSLGQITSARTLERQISRLMTDELPEIQEIGEELKASVVEKSPINLQLEKAQQDESLQALTPLLETGPLLPTLAKYTSPNRHQFQTRQALQKVASELLQGIEPEKEFGVKLHTYQEPLRHAVTTLLYSVSNLSYGQIDAVVARLSKEEKKEILELAFAHRGRHDAWLRELQAQPLIFDITMDIGSFRDLNRHRKVAKTLQRIDGSLGYVVPDDLQKLGLAEKFTAEMDAYFAEIGELAESWSEVESRYLLPLGTLCRSLHQMDLHQAAYLVELRTGSAGHFSYREIAYQMYERVVELYPEFAEYMRVTNPREVYNPFQR